ncbi:MAG: helix-turn-helix domain-containing protein, partial [Clostridium sp.]|nr:helix-turn-helix domain-containing protein [Clostridium sp.]
GIVDVAVPVMVGDKYLGAVMFGQVRLMNKDAEKAVRLVNEISSFQAEEEAARKDLLEMYERLPEMEYERIVEIADLINSIVEYTVDRAVKSRNQAETYQWLLKMNADAEDSMAEIQELRQPLSQQPSAREPISVKPSSAIYPAISFIRDHPRENVSMKEMAELCHLSPSYFSRLFNRETGENFVNYVNRQKIELAKEQLRGTSKSISQIAGELGYLNVSNFIAVFKRMEGVTPSIYRQHMFK